MIDQDSDSDATIVQISFGDRLGALIDTVIWLIWHDESFEFLKCDIFAVWFCYLRDVHISWLRWLYKPCTCYYAEVLVSFSHAHMYTCVCVGME